mgnify:FL=1
MKIHKLITILLSILIGFNTVDFCYGEESEIYKESEEQNLGYISSDLDFNTPVVEHSVDGISTIDTLVPSAFQTDVNALNAKYPDVRDQGNYGACWSFSTMGLMEYDLINKNQADRNISLSPLQLAYFTYNFVQDPLGGTVNDKAYYHNENAAQSYLDTGGNYEYSIRRLSQWIGAVNEADVPYALAGNTITTALDSKYAYDYNSVYLQNAYLINIKQNPDDVKEMIMNHGGVGVMYAHYYDGMTSTVSPAAYYDNGNQKYGGGAHAVMIVGWDDNYSKDNFQTAEKPTRNGAWLVRNSWGFTYSYFWMSYDTLSLGDTAYAFDCTNTRPYDNNYQLDGGIESYMNSNITSAYNVYTVQKREDVVNETLKAVSLSFTKTANVNYTLEVYTNIYAKYNPSYGNNKPVLTQSGTTTYAGVYTIPLNQEVVLEPGAKYCIVVKTDKGAIEYEQSKATATNPGAEDSKPVWDQSVSIADYLSYYKTAESTAYSASWYNFRIKAFTTNNYKEKKDISNAVIAKNVDFTEDNPSVMVTYGETSTLIKGVDYTEVYTTDENGITVTITGQGDYTGSLSKTFIPVSNLTVKCKDVAYTGEEVIPEVTVENDVGILTNDVDYSLIFSNNINVGEEAIVTIQGLNEYYGSKEVKFQIYKDLGAELSGISLSLDGLINYNFYYTLPEEILNDDYAYVVFTLPDGRQEKQYVKDTIVKENGYRGFSCGVYAMEMTKKVKAQLFNSAHEGGRIYYRSIEDYVNIVKGLPSYASVIPLLNAMLNYGGYSQDLFNYNITDKAYKAVKEDYASQMESLQYDDFTAYKLTTLDSNDNVSVAGLSLELKNGTTLRIYFDIKDISKVDSSSVKVNDTISSLKKNSKGYYLEVENIKSNRLDEFYTFSLGGTTIKACGLSYVYSSLKFNISTDVSKALYVYFNESKSYFSKG